MHAPCATRTLLNRAVSLLTQHSRSSPATLLGSPTVCSSCQHLLPSSHLLTKGSCSCTSCDSTRPLTGPHSRLLTHVQAGFHHSRSGRLISWRSSVTTSSAAAAAAAQCGCTQQRVGTQRGRSSSSAARSGRSSSVFGRKASRTTSNMRPRQRQLPNKCAANGAGTRNAVLKRP